VSTCTQRADAVGAAFSALEPDEERAVQAHLPHCADCRRAFDEALEVVAALGAAVPSVAPPAGLKGRVLTAARAEPGTSVRVVQRPVSPAPAADERPGPTVPAPRTRRRRLVTAAGGLVAAVVLGVGLIVAQGVLPTQEAPPDTPAVALAQQADRIVDDARSRDPGLRSTVLRGQAGEPAAVVLDPGDAAAPVRMVSLDLPATGNQRDYVLWATGMPGNAPVAVAVMDPADGVTRPVGDTAGPSGPGEPGPRGWAVSVEPAGPVPAGPSTVVAVGLTAA
jgi:anti-sigma-K factor RskA